MKIKALVWVLFVAIFILPLNLAVLSIEEENVPMADNAPMVDNAPFEINAKSAVLMCEYTGQFIF